MEYSSLTIHVGVVVVNLQASLNFYQNVLGFKRTDVYNVDAEFARKSGLTNGCPVTIEVLKLADDEHATQWKLMSFDQSQESRPPAGIQDRMGMQYMTLLVKALNPFLANFALQGVELLGESPVQINDDLWFALIQDPDGNLIEVIGPRE